MKAFFFLPFVVDQRLQFTSKNELAKSFCNLGNTMSIYVGYKNKKIELDGFSEVTYTKIKYPFFSKFNLYLKIFHKIYKDKYDVIIIGDRLAFLLPILSIFRNLFNKNMLLISDIRTIPVNVADNYKKKFIKKRFSLSVRFIDFFSDGLTVITPATLEYIKPFLKRLSDNVGIWSSGVNMKIFSKEGDNSKEILNPHNKKVLVYHGEFVKSRGLDNLIYSLQILNKKNDNFLLILLGDGKDKDYLKDLVLSLKLSNNVVFIDPVSYKEVPKILRVADCAVLPFPDVIGWSVSSPLKIMEYIALDLRIVATDILAHREIKNIFNSIKLAKNNKPDVLADSIESSFRTNKINMDYTLIKDNISWESQAKNLIKYINSLENK
jgi:glycosyltransferase involved in cell wall biosynthesis